MLLAKMREAIIAVRAGRVTLPYPFAPRPPAPGFRGKLVVDGDLCIGCAGCANVCEANVIQVHDPAPDRRVVEFQWRRCTYCGRCAEVCPEGAVKQSLAFETATDRPEDLVIRIEVFMGPCQRCGRCFPPPTPLERMKRTGFRPTPGGRL